MIAAVFALAVLAPVAVAWQASLLPSSYSVMDMGYHDLGGGPDTAGPPRSVASLVEPTDRAPDVDVTLVARKESVHLASGKVVDGYTLNGTSPGPVLHAVAGQLVQVRLVNASVPDGVTLHWHGVDVPGAEDGVAGVTQDAVPVGGEFTYRFVAKQAGTYWYHSHQMSHDQVLRGLLGAIVVTPREGLGAVVDAPALVHLYEGQRTINGLAGDVAVPAAVGSTVRARVINTDNGPMSVWVSGAAFRVVAVDGTDLHGPTPLQDTSVTVTSGGRVDVEVTVPPGGARVEMGNAALVLGPSRAAPAPRPAHTLDLLTYGTPTPLPFNAESPDRAFQYVIGRSPGFIDGLPGFWWTINGHLYPDVPMFVVSEGDVVTMHIVNSSGEVHPMHLHGHHAVVLGRNGVAARGSPWWVDSLDVADGDSYDIAFLADNPGIWMDHCHNLPHAAQGLVAHLMYTGVTEPYRVGGATDNQPE